MRGCRHARRRIWAYLQDPYREAWVGEHLRTCPKCAAEAARLEHEAQSLRAAAGGPEMPDADRMWAGISSRLPARRGLAWRAWVPLAPAAILALLWVARPSMPGRTTDHRPRTADQVAETRDPRPKTQDWAAPAMGDRRQETGDRPIGHRKGARVVLAKAEVHRPGGRSARRHTAAPVALALRDPITQSPNHPITPSPNHPITQSPNHPVTPSPNHPVTLAASPLRMAEPAEGPAPSAAVMVVHAPRVTPEGGADASVIRTFTRSEVADPATGTTSRLTVTRELDASGTARRVTIDYQVSSSAAGGASSES